MKTGKGLVDYTNAQLGKPYWWGTYGQYSNKKLYEEYKKMYPAHYNSDDYLKQFGVKVHDCSGLIKGYRWCETPESAPKYVSSQDVNAKGLYLQCSERGDIKNLPEEPGVLVFYPTFKHVGVYIGNGLVNEARGHAYGVVQTRLVDRPQFGVWGKPTWIQYSYGYYEPYQMLDLDGKELVDSLPMLRITNKGTYVKLLQILLQYNKYNLEADGDFGSITERCVINWQEKKKIEIDGIVGKQTWASLILA